MTVAQQPSGEMLKDLEAAEKEQEEVLKELFTNPQVDKLGKYVAYLLQRDSANQEQSLMFNALLSTVVDILEEKGIIDKETFAPRLEQTVKGLNDELLQQYAEFQEKVEEAEKQDA